MVSKIDGFLIGAQLRWRRFVEDFRSDESGLAGVVVAVLLIVVAVLAVVLIWGLLSETLQNWWTNLVEGQTGDLNQGGAGGGTP